jgi:hypothetical protein
MMAKSQCLQLLALLALSKQGIVAYQTTPIKTLSTRRVLPSATSAVSSATCTRLRPPLLLLLDEHRRSWSSLQMSEELASYDDTTADKEAKKIAGRKSRVITGYRAASLAYLASATILSLANGYRSKQHHSMSLFAACWFQAYTVAGPILASGVAYILTDAAVKDNLQSDTYKRFNLFLGQYAALTLSMVYLAPDSFASPIFIVPSLLGLINSSKGYAYGALGWDKKTGSYKEEMVQAVKSTIQTLVLTPPKNLASLGYLGATLTVGSMKVAQLVEIVTGTLVQQQQATIPLVVIATRLSRLAKLSLLTAVLFTLKDTADRDRLGGTTFIELNFLSSFVLGTMAGRSVQGMHVCMHAAMYACMHFNNLDGKELVSWGVCFAFHIISNTTLLLLLLLLVFVVVVVLGSFFRLLFQPLFFHQARP